MMKTYRVLLLALAALPLSGCVQQNEVNTLQSRVAQQDQVIQQLHGQLAGVQPAQADTWAQVQTLRQEMATLKGQIDDFNHATAGVGGLPGLADRMARHDAALRQLETQFAINLNLDTPMQPSAGAPGMSGAPAGSGAYPAVGAGNEASTGITAPGAAPAVQTPQAPPQAADQQKAPAANTDVAKVLYDSGYKYFTSRKYKESLNAFTDFTKTYPNHKLTGNAWFWRAESSFQLNNFANAALDYEQVITKYPSNEKVPSAYLKQAMCFAKVNKKDVARYRLDDLIKKFPKSPEATRAKQLLNEMK